MNSPLAPLSTLKAQQPQCVDQLQRAFAQGRLYSAYVLLGGPASTASQVAYSLAQTTLCAVPAAQRPTADACGSCSACSKVASGSHPDLLHLQPLGTAATVRLDAVHAACRRLALVPNEGIGKVLLCTDANSLSRSVQNALLKAMEEPSGNTLFVLIAAGRGALLPTLRSRCQTLSLRPDAAAAADPPPAALPPDPLLQAALRALYGADAAAAQAAQQAGLGTTLTALLRLLRPDTDVDDALRTAAELGAEPASYAQALLLCELILHTSLQRALGVDLGASHQPLCLPTALSAACLDGLADTLQGLRRHRASHLNRAMALSDLLLPWVVAAEAG
jgi:hypothetical protein